MAAMHLAGVEGGGLDGAVGMGGDAAVAQQAHGDDLSRRFGERRSGVRRLAVMFNETHDAGAIGQDDQLFLQAHQQVIDLPCFGFGFVLLDFTNGKAVQFAGVAEKNSVAAVPFLERCEVAASAAPLQYHVNAFTRNLPSLW
jgi:hypothetical protein